MNESKIEQLSVLMDGEHSELEARSAIDAGMRDQGLRAVWERMHLVRDVMRGDVPERVDPKFAERVRERIGSEPAILAPYASRSRFSRPLTAIAIAASVAAVAILGVRQFNHTPASPAPVSVAVQEAATEPPPTIQADFERPPSSVVQWSGASPAAASRLNGYLVNYSEQRSNLGVSSIPPYVRIVGYEAQE